MLDARRLLTLLIPAVLTSAALATGAQVPMANHEKDNPVDMPSMHDVTSGLETLQGEAFETAFLSLMIAHHQGALDMAHWVLERGADPAVRGTAEAIIAAQEVEIQQMTVWLREWYGEEAGGNAVTTMTDDMTSMTQAMDQGANPDRAFMEEMIRHHQSAIDMAQVALVRAEHDELRTLARDIITAQAEEVRAYADLLAGLAIE